MLTIVIAVSVTKGGLEDIKRHESDARQNNSVSHRLRPCTHGSSDAASQLEEVLWKDICVGDIISVTAGNPIPADLIFEPYVCIHRNFQHRRRIESKDQAVCPQRTVRLNQSL